jgi:hypothetical protein
VIWVIWVKMVTFTLLGGPSDQPWWRIISPWVGGSRATPTRACAFNAMHDVLQGVVRITLVMVPGRPRLDLPALHASILVIVSPRPNGLNAWSSWTASQSHTNKLLRVKLGERWDCLAQRRYAPIERTFEAKCPPQGTLETPSLCTVVASASAVEKVLVEALVASETSNLWWCTIRSRIPSVSC